MLADALGLPLRFLITPGQTGDITAAPTLLERRKSGAVLADKAYDSNALRAIESFGLAAIEGYIDPYGCVMAGEMAPVWARGRKTRR